MRESLAAGVARAQRVLADAPLPWDGALQHVADALVPTVADTFTLAVGNDDGELRVVAAAGGDAARSAALSELMARVPLTVDSDIPLAVAHRTGRSMVLRGGFAGSPGIAPDLAELFRRVVPSVVAVVPMRVRDRAVGALALGFEDEEHPIGAGDLPAVEDLGYACAIAIDNARLYRTAQQALAESGAVLAQLDSVLSGAPIGIGIYDRELRYLRCNRALAEIDGTTPEEAVGRTLSELLPEVARVVDPVMRRVLDTGEPLTGLAVSATTPATPDDVRHWDVSYVPVRDDGGEVAAIAAIVVEVTEQRRARDALDARVRQQAALAQLSRAALESADVVALLERAVDQVAGVLEVPMVAILELLPAGERLALRASVGWEPGEATIPAGAESHAGYALVRGETVVVEDLGAETRFSSPALSSHVPPKSGLAVPIGGRVLPFGVIAVHSGARRRYSTDEVDFVESVAAVLQGAIVRDEAERLLARGQKLEAVGRLAGGLAHDFNNLLTVVTVNAELIAEDPQHPRFGEAMAEIRDATDRASRLARQILTFSRGARPPADTTDLSVALQELHELLVPLLRSDVVLELAIDEVSPLTVKMAAGQLEQVVMNLAINARDAMPGGGRLVIDCDLVDVPEGVDLPPRDPSSPYVRLRVVDEGEGMDADTRSRALDPFFTTKGEEEGTGLGLSTAWALVRAAGGDLTIDSEPGRGTTVTVFLPAEWNAAIRRPVGVEDAAEALPPARGSILVVEDQPAIRRLVQQTLESAGYRVTVVPDGMTACEVEDRPDLVLTDLVMPGMSGDEVVRSLRGRWPDVPALYMSGYAGGLPEAPELPPGRFLAKPFGLRELLDAVAAALS